MCVFYQVFWTLFWQSKTIYQSEVEFSRTSLASRTHFEVFGLGLEPQVLENCPVLGSRTALFFEPLKFCRKEPKTAQKIFEDLFLFSSSGNCLNKFFEDLFLRLLEKIFWKTFFLENTCACVLGLWPQEGLSLASNFFVSLASSLVSSTPPLLPVCLMIYETTVLILNQQPKYWYTACSACCHKLLHLYLTV